MDDEPPPFNSGYQSFSNAPTESTNAQTITITSPPSAAANVPARYQTNQQKADRSLQEDLRQTASGEIPTVFA